MNSILQRIGILIDTEHFYRWVDVIEANDNSSDSVEDNIKDYDSAVIGLCLSIY